MYSALVCDDEKAQREGLAHHVHWADYGFEAPVLCANAWEALRAMETRTFDLLMTDVRMPGKDGLELAAECHTRQSDLYIVMISSYAEFDYARSAMKNGAREYLLKPIRPSDVHGILSAFLQWKSTGDESGISTDANAQRAMQLLEEHVEEGITIARLAEEVHMNASYLCTLFKKTYGITISEQLNLLQQKRACQLLATTDLSIGEIGARTGGRSASNFGQWFRKRVGMTPGDYRHLLRSSQTQDIGREHRDSDARKG